MVESQLSAMGGLAAGWGGGGGMGRANGTSQGLPDPSLLQTSEQVSQTRTSAQNTMNETIA